MGNQIKNYPVDNGDQSLITIEENGITTNIMVDCNIRDSSMDDSDPSQYDVKKDLLNTLKRRKVNDIDGVPYTDIFILTHGDDDHIHGFEKNFYQGDPKAYKQKHKDQGEILIDVLWFSPMVMGTATNDDERCFNREAKRRIKLHKDKDAAKDLPGNRIVIIGYDANEKLDDLDLVRRVPGDVVSRFNERDLQTFSIFIHSPYQQHLTDDEVDKNRVSVVFQARFKARATDTNFSTLAMFGGDADHKAWATILEKTKKYKNDVNQRALDWDILIAPHHCSWTFFNECPQDKNPDPAPTSIEFLGYRRKGGKVVASSKLIENNDDNPPHYKAKEQYLDKLDKDSDFLNTANHPNSSKPEPIIFVITENGPSKAPKVSSGSSITAAGGAGAAGRSITQG
ncbi:ComEC/Rec2 family competence protein [Chitinophaga flava]|uniref:Cobyric acid synthase CobQ n=1 Tax=Chitinophaga flava TaxID=2259036 RepID=A0A365XVS7_9BACT|nr:cobyric acid synthase CobQ [Chitinophaga flava]RBL90459.1 cobyric acid synthase CobQ [Chitinophaga flava]